MKYNYTKADAVKTEKGWAINFTLPSSGKEKIITAGTPDHAADTVNHFIMSDLRTADAMAPYREAVKVLSKMCLGHSGSGSRAAAQVLLSTYNGYNYHMDLTDLCHLDEANFYHAIAVLNGRVFCSKEPHNMIENGADIFSEIAQKWSSLHIENRY